MPLTYTPYPITMNEEHDTGTEPQDHATETQNYFRQDHTRQREHPLKGILMRHYAYRGGHRMVSGGKDFIFILPTNARAFSPIRQK